MKPPYSGDDKLRKKYRRLKAAFIIVLLMFGATVFFNIEYLIFKVFISAGYAYTETLDGIFSSGLGAENFKGYFRDFDRVVISLFCDRIRAEGDDGYTFLYTPQSYRESKEATKADAMTEEIRGLSDDTVYIMLPNISSYTRKFFINNKELLAGYKNIIIDLRWNYGGMLSDYYKISELFLDKGDVIGYEIIRPDILSRTIKSNNTPYFDFENIIILQNGGTASSAEGLIMSLKENLDNVTLIGEKSFGKGIGQATVPLLGGYAVKATVIKLETPGGDTIHRIGIEPDIIYYNEDIIDAALRFTEEER